MSENQEVGGGGSSGREDTVTLLRRKAKQMREEANGLEELATLIQKRGKVFGDGREDPEPLWWAFFVRRL